MIPRVTHTQRPFYSPEMVWEIGLLEALPTFLVSLIPSRVLFLCLSSVCVAHRQHGVQSLALCPTNMLKQTLRIHADRRHGLRHRRRHGLRHGFSHR